jgi:hypothetical protein
MTRHLYPFHNPPCPSLSFTLCLDPYIRFSFLSPTPLQKEPEVKDAPLHIPPKDDVLDSASTQLGQAHDAQKGNPGGAEDTPGA